MGGLDLVRILKQRGAVGRCLVMSGAGPERLRQLCQADPQIRLLAQTVWQPRHSFLRSLIT